MGSEKHVIIDKAALTLVGQACRVMLGMPAYAIRACVFRIGSPLSPYDLVGLTEDTFGTSVLDDYERRYGYHFSWGTLSECISEGLVDDEEEEVEADVVFEFTPRDVYLMFPDGWHLRDLFSWLYRWHPLRHRKFVADPDDVDQEWSVIAFTAQGESEIAALRDWLVNVFIPLIWPELLSEAMKIIKEKTAHVTSPVVFEKLVAGRARWMLCGKRKSLSFYKRR